MTDVVERFKSILKSEGLQPAMRWLNESVAYRFTAIFAFDGDMLRNVCLVDKQDPGVSKCADQPITESYCMYINRSRQLFTVEEARLDGRVEQHPKRSAIQSYYGIPLFDTEGKMLGTVCHFDSLPVRVTEQAAELLDDLGPTITEAAFESE